ncbi:MAG: nicotinamidase-like amidase [Thermoleophilia bacterium]|jgi:nicotinamidase-related amidase|nr:nicotinamidase-like amidase [Thermoleophilia bacterium]
MADERDRTPHVAPTAALLIVHMQRGFAAEAPEVEALALRIARHVRERADRYALITAARFVARPDGPYARFIEAGSMQTATEQELLPAIAELPGLVTSDADAYSAVTPELLARLRAAGVEQVHVAGIDTDQCVLATVFALFDAGLEPIALANLCLSTSGETPHEAGLVALRRALNEERVIE